MGTETATTNVPALLRAARARIADEAHFTTGVFARDRSNHPVTYISPDAIRWCAFGAIAREVFEQRGAALDLRIPDTMRRLICEAGDSLYPQAGNMVPNLNDHYGHAAVLACYDLAIARAEERGW